LNNVDTSIRKTEFFTTSELAQKLKMNVQVITRKVQAGEIHAYKIGKDWRIPEHSVVDWLEKNSNRNGKSETRPTPVRRANKKPGGVSINEPRRTALLEYIMAQFEPQREYSEQHVDRIIARHHSDTSSVRSELVALGMLTNDRGQYSRVSDYRMSPTG
jgi:excisionase family DNA binding protein